MTTIAFDNGTREVGTADLTDTDIDAVLAQPSLMDDSLRERCHALFAGTGDAQGFVRAYAQMHQRKHGVPFTLP